MKKFSFAMPFLFCVLFLNAQNDSKLISSDTIYFEFAENELNAQSKSQLKAILNQLTQSELLKYSIQAHTDNIGSSDFNLKLSNERAKSVEHYLKSTGIAFESGQLEGLGEENPLADNSEPSGRQLNRCAVIRIYADEDKEAMSSTEEFTEKGISEEELPSMPQKVISGVLKDPETGEPLAGEIIIKTDQGIDTIKTDANGKYELKRPENSAVSMDVFVPGYFYQSLKIAKNETVNEIKLEKAEVGKTSRISNLQFQVSTAKLLPESVPELEKLLRFMQENEVVNIEISGHVSGSGGSPEGSVNHNLSIKRGKMVYDYLIENSIDSSRMSYSGYSDWQRINTNPITQKDHQVNRRVEIKVIEKEE